MSHYDFDRIIDRRGTDALKYDFAAENGMPEGLLPLWVADMDFQSPPCVGAVLEEIARKGIFGYTVPRKPYYDAVLGWYRTQFGWEADRKWVVRTSGVVFAIAVALEALTKPGDGVMIQPPVYYPFAQVIEKGGRKLVCSPLVLEQGQPGGQYRMNFAEIEEKISSGQVKAFLLCSPHNPVGRVWTREELHRLGEICRAHDVLVISDEIHSDFIWGDRQHTIFATAGDGFDDFSVICTAPSKTFNLAGLQNANIFIPNQKLRRQFRAVLDRMGAELQNQMGLAACRAAYESGLEWLDAVRHYIRDNIDYIGEYLRNNIPGIHMIDPEGTYLVWLDCRGLGLDDAALNRLITEQAGLWLDAGSIFGAEGSGFQRINAACPRVILQQAMEQLASAVAAL